MRHPLITEAMVEKAALAIFDAHDESEQAEAPYPTAPQMALAVLEAVADDLIEVCVKELQKPREFFRDEGTVADDIDMIRDLKSKSLPHDTEV